MEKVLYLAHTDDNGELSKLALETLTGAVETAKALGAELSVGIFGSKADSAINNTAGCGAVKYLTVSGDEYAKPRYSTDAAAAVAIVKASTATIVLAPATSRLARCLGGVSARLNGRIDTRVTGLETAGGTLEITRWYYRQRMVAKMSREQRPWFISLEGGAYEAFSGSGTATATAVIVEPVVTKTTVKGAEATSVGEQTIKPDAKLLFVAGAGWTKKQADGQPHVKDAEELIRKMLGKSQASLGSSKSLVDQSGEGQEVISFLTHMNQVGQTGATPRHLKGLATCCHGEEPHVVGWRFVTERRAVNLDPNCGWSQGKADVVYVADAFKVVEKVLELL